MMQFDWIIQALQDIFLNEENLAAIYAYLAAMVLLVALLLISRWQRLGLVDKLVIGTIRGTIQIILMALILIQVFALENIFILYFVLVFMCTFAAYTAKGNLKKIPGVFRPSLVGILVGGLSVLTLCLLLGILPPSGDYNLGEFLIPMGGMVIGNAMNISTLVIERMWSNAQKQRSLMETALALGATPHQATEMTIRESLTTGLLPNLNRYASLGIVTIPGLMSGMIIGGASPMFAAFYQVIVFIMIFLAQVIDGELVSRLFLKEMFNDRYQIIVPPQTT